MKSCLSSHLVKWLKGKRRRTNLKTRAHPLCEFGRVGRAGKRMMGPACLTYQRGVRLAGSEVIHGVLHSPPSPFPAPSKPSATSATQELDRLMASLSDFRVQNHVSLQGFWSVSLCGSPIQS